VLNGERISFEQQERAVTITVSFWPGASFLKGKHFTCQLGLESCG